MRVSSCWAGRCRSGSWSGATVAGSGGLGDWLPPSRMKTGPRAEPKNRRLGILPATRVFGQQTKVNGELVENGEVVHQAKVVDEGDELARRFTIRARVALEEHAASEAIRRAAATSSPPMKTFEPSTSCFFHRHYPGKRAETAMRGSTLVVRPGIKS